MKTVLKASEPFPIVGIGASAGGLEALRGLFQHMPSDSGLAFVAITHQAPEQPSLLRELLEAKTSIPVVTATDGLEVEPNHIYVSPPGSNVALLGGRLHLMRPEQEHALSIDYFLRSLARDQKERAICIILSGTGTDGTLGLRDIKGESGMAMVQDEATAKHAGMPRSARATNLVDYVLPVEEMPERLIAYARGSFRGARPEESQHDRAWLDSVQKIFVLLRSRSGADLSSYKMSTMKRRIERRMSLHAIDTPDHYLRFLERNATEIDLLFKDLLIGVTSFFRDPEAWDALAEEVTRLLETRTETEPLRAWVAGCSTGEEAYSLAMLLVECLQRARVTSGAQIFASDLDPHAIDVARAGSYPIGVGVDVNRRRLNRFFTAEGDHYRVSKDIRKLVVFACQNVAEDPPFAKLDILSCRNLLIYFDASLQQQVMPVFHHALKPGGILFLGTSETIGGYGEYFSTSDKKQRIYRRKAGPAVSLKIRKHRVVPPVAAADRPPRPQNPAAEVSSYRLAERAMIENALPPSVIAHENGEIVHIHGRTGDYLEPARGAPSSNVFDMAREGLKHELLGAFRKLSPKKREILSEGVRVKSSGHVTFVDLRVQSLLEPEALRGLVLVSFERPRTAPVRKKKSAAPRPAPPRVTQLEWELDSTRESLQSTIEELETANEELKSTNEELQSTNEELQSSNEELETSKEDLSSMNEELQSVNLELGGKIADVAHTQDDLRNLLNSTNIATIFLDNQLTIKRFTEQAQFVTNLLPTDIGRPLAGLAEMFHHETLVADAERVLRTLVSKEVEVQIDPRSWYLLRLMPYRTGADTIDGLVLTVVDVTRLKRAERMASTYAQSIVQTVKQPLLLLDPSLRVISANRAFFKRFAIMPADAIGRAIYDIAGGRLDSPKLRQLLEELLPTNAVIEDFVLPLGSGADHISLQLSARRLEREPGQPELILIALTGGEVPS